MAFTCLESWDARQAPRGGMAGAAVPARIESPMLGERASLYARKGSATILSALIHLLLLWLFVNKLAGGPGEGLAPGGEGRGLTVIDLSGAPTPASTAQPETPPQPLVQPAVQQTMMDTAIKTELPKPEWSVARIRMPAELQPPAPQMRIAAASAPSGGGNAAGRNSGDGGTGAAGGGGEAPYDPFAGAAPLRRQPVADLRAQLASLGEQIFGGGETSNAAGQLILDREALSAIARRVAQSVPGARGTAEFVVRVSPDGIILGATSGGGSATARAKTALREALIGKPLYRAAGSLSQPQTLRLPSIRLS